jgi:hypothetical protein
MQLILKQLSALKKQYRDDLEELTQAYERRRKVLKESLNMFVTPATVGDDAQQLQGRHPE